MATDHIHLATELHDLPAVVHGRRWWDALLAWLNEPVSAEAHNESQHTSREWADLPVHHPERDD